MAKAPEMANGSHALGRRTRPETCETGAAGAFYDERLRNIAEMDFILVPFGEKIGTSRASTYEDGW